MKWLYVHLFRDGSLVLQAFRRQENSPELQLTAALHRNIETMVYERAKGRFAGGRLFHIVRFLLNTAEFGYTIGVFVQTYLALPGALALAGDTGSAGRHTAALLQPLIRNRLILAGCTRKMQPLIDVLLEGHVAAREQPGLLAVLERFVRVHRAKTRVQLLLQQGF